MRNSNTIVRKQFRTQIDYYAHNSAKLFRPASRTFVGSMQSNCIAHRVSDPLSVAHRKPTSAMLHCDAIVSTAIFPNMCNGLFARPCRIMQIHWAQTVPNILRRRVAMPHRLHTTESQATSSHINQKTKKTLRSPFAQLCAELCPHANIKHTHTLDD